MKRHYTVICKIPIMNEGRPTAVRVTCQPGDRWTEVVRGVTGWTPLEIYFVLEGHPRHAAARGGPPPAPVIAHTIPSQMARHINRAVRRRVLRKVGSHRMLFSEAKSILERLGSADDAISVDGFATTPRRLCAAPDCRAVDIRLTFGTESRELVSGTLLDMVHERQDRADG